jgi:hypothetical protein
VKPAKPWQTLVAQASQPAVLQHLSRIHAVKDFLTTDGHRWTQMKNVVFKHHVKRII